MEEISVDAVLFDLDGTLVDSFEISKRWWRRWVVDIGLDWDSIAHQVRGRAAVEVMRDLLPERPDRLNEADAASLERWEDTNTALIQAAAGAAGLLERLDGQRWAVVTTSTRDQARARLDAAGLPRPEVLVTADDVSGLKPDPEGYLLASSALGADPANCLVIEDSVAGVRAGCSAGAKVLGVGESTMECGSSGIFWARGLHDVTVLARSSGLRFGIAAEAS